MTARWIGIAMVMLTGTGLALAHLPLHGGQERPKEPKPGWACDGPFNSRAECWACCFVQAGHVQNACLNAGGSDEYCAAKFEQAAELCMAEDCE